jgi:hypothetical protein
MRVMEKLYVYAYLRAADSPNGEAGTPYYIGNGKGRRAFHRGRRFNNVPRSRENIVFISKDMNEKDAFQLEMFMIFLHGRVDVVSGILNNHTDGGEGPCGLRFSEETRAKWSAQRKGRVFTEEHCRKISESRKGWKARPETIEKIRVIARNRAPRKMSTEQRIAISERLRGHTISEETKNKIRESLKGRKATPEARANQSAAQLGKKRARKEVSNG